jgi:hypothetical protein
MDKGAWRCNRSVPLRLIFPPFSDFDKANEILFRLGIIYKQQGKYDSSLEVKHFCLPGAPF